LKLHNPFKKYNIKKAIKQNLWSGKYFYDDITKKEIITGDSNVMPFWTGVFTDKKMFKNCVDSIKKAGLDKPIPLKYSTGKKLKMNIVSKFVSNYEHDAIWMHMGLLYAQLVKGYKPKYKKLIEKHSNFLEVFNPDGTPFRSKFYYADESMLWSANYLTL